jgi:hypothetical protein
MERDTPDRIPFFGFVVPAVIPLLVAFNLVRGEVYWPDKHAGARLFTVYRDAWRFWGTIGFKIGMAGGIFAWSGLANFPRYDRYATPVLVGSIIAAVLGLTSFCMGMFR